MAEKKLAAMKASGVTAGQDKCHENVSNAINTVIFMRFLQQQA